MAHVRYKHFKGGIYKVLGVATPLPRGFDVEGLKKTAVYEDGVNKRTVYIYKGLLLIDWYVSCVVYVSEDKRVKTIYARSVDDFFGWVDRGGKVFPRFQKLLYSKLDNWKDPAVG